MKEISQIIDACSKLDLSRQRAALATVVKVEGSSYRRPGARMLITEDGRLTGAISGGCLEGDALRKALLVIRKGEATIVTYDTTDEDDAKLGVGLGCNGIIHVLIEPLSDIPENPVELLRKLASKRQSGVLITLFSLEDRLAVPPGTCALFTRDVQWHNEAAASQLLQLFQADARLALYENRSFFRSYQNEGEWSAFVELIVPPVALVIFGAGNDVQPLTELAFTLGWKTTVVDGRVSHARKERFPQAGEVVVSRAADVLKHFIPDPQTCFVLMTHNYHYDLEVLKLLTGIPTRYIGVLGPKKKMQRMLAEPGMNIEGNLSSVYGPVGLDIGAEAPEEIALSIVSEIKAVLSGRDAVSLRDLPDTIHSRAAFT